MHQGAGAEGQAAEVEGYREDGSRWVKWPTQWSREHLAEYPPGALQDAHEFLNFLLNEISEILEKEEERANRERAAQGGKLRGGRELCQPLAVYSWRQGSCFSRAHLGGQG